ncbi:MAG: hypothetical protein GXP42_11440 [Chloroflexi bacterium]|nr:hypothetical protein [Chloroflexota bacterium]
MTSNPKTGRSHLKRHLQAIARTIAIQEEIDAVYPRVEADVLQVTLS